MVKKEKKNVRKKKPVRDVEKKGWFKRLSNVEKTLLKISALILAVAGIGAGTWQAIVNWEKIANFFCPPPPPPTGLVITHLDTFPQIILEIGSDFEVIKEDSRLGINIDRKSLFRFEIKNWGKDLDSVIVLAQVPRCWRIGGLRIDGANNVVLDNQPYREEKGDWIHTVSSRIIDFPTGGKIYGTVWVTYGCKEFETAECYVWCCVSATIGQIS